MLPIVEKNCLLDKIKGDSLLDESHEKEIDIRNLRDRTLYQLALLLPRMGIERKIARR